MRGYRDIRQTAWKPEAGDNGRLMQPHGGGTVERISVFEEMEDINGNFREYSDEKSLL